MSTSYESGEQSTALRTGLLKAMACLALIATPAAMLGGYEGYKVHIDMQQLDRGQAINGGNNPLAWLAGGVAQAAHNLEHHSTKH